MTEQTIGSSTIYYKSRLRRFSIVFLVMLGLSLNATAQNLSSIFTNIDTLYMPGAQPGNIIPTSANVTPIVSNNPCSHPLENFVVATEYQNGRVLAVGHESILRNNSINSYDNLQFLMQAMNWLGRGSKRVTLKEDWVNGSNSSIFQSALTNDGYTFNLLNGNITTASLSNTDILILGNDWNNSQPYSAAELSDLNDFVANGGALLIAGLGWSWPNALNLYPMNQAANLFGFKYTTTIIQDFDNNINGAPKFYNFYPENMDSVYYGSCSPYIGINLKRGDTLRVLKIALSTNAGFTQANGGVNSTIDTLKEWLKTINTIYGREYCMHFELAPNNDQLIFDNPTTDPWNIIPPNSMACDDATIIFNEQPFVIDSIIGAANYDLSQVILSQYGGGCTGGLKMAISGAPYHSVLRHEMGHQFGQMHTVDHPDSTNYEPENGGWTIQGGNKYGYAHAVSFQQLADYLKNIFPDKGTKIATGNAIPTVYAGPDCTIPISTPFTVTATASDSNSEDSLTYVWDNLDPGPPQYIPVPDDTQGALFMRLLPRPDSSRTFPKMSDVLGNNNVNAQEQLPTHARMMDIRVTVNDNHKMMYQGHLINASGINSDDIQIQVADAGPFVVTSQNTQGISYIGGTNQLVTWDVNGTNVPPVNTQNVKITLSTDGGYTYPYTLLQSTNNSGQAFVTLPDIATTMARIKVAANNSIYFDVNLRNFEITSILSIKTSSLNGSSVKIYPNPAKGFFKIDLSHKINFKTEVYSPQGQLMETSLNKNKVDISHFSNGLYIIVITDLDSQEKLRKNIVIKR